MSGHFYKGTFYDKTNIGAVQSSKVIVPIVIDLVSPKSVVDVGCGAGAWLAAFEHAGLKDIMGIDGEWISLDKLFFDPKRFLRADLSKRLTGVNRKFDLVVSLEVAEHIPTEQSGTFVDNLVSLGDVVMFSAAVKYQGGENHINEQWQEFWAELFEARGFVAVDAIRRRVWNDKGVRVCYAQNTILYVKKSRLKGDKGLERELELTCRRMISAIHPYTLKLVGIPYERMRHFLPRMAKKIVKFIFRLG